VMPDEQARACLISHFEGPRHHAVFHYQSLHTSPYFAGQHDGRPMPNADRYSNCLVRLPLFHDLTDAEQATIIQSVIEFFQ